MPARLIEFVGLPGSGKTVLATLVSERLRRATPTSNASNRYRQLGVYDILAESPGTVLHAVAAWGPLALLRLGRNPAGRRLMVKALRYRQAVASVDGMAVLDEGVAHSLAVVEFLHGRPGPDRETSRILRHAHAYVEVVVPPEVARARLGDRNHSGHEIGDRLRRAPIDSATWARVLTVQEHVSTLARQLAPVIRVANDGTRPPAAIAEKVARKLAEAGFAAPPQERARSRSRRSRR